MFSEYSLPPVDLKSLFKSLNSGWETKPFGSETSNDKFAFIFFKSPKLFLKSPLNLRLLYTQEL